MSFPRRPASAPVALFLRNTSGPRRGRRRPHRGRHRPKHSKMRFDKYTIKAQEAVQRAQETAQRMDHAEILPLHLLAALLEETEGVVQPLLQRIGANVGRIRQIVTSELERLPRATGTQLGMNRSTTEVFQQAQKEADRLKDEYVSTEHLLLALAKVKSPTQEILTTNAVTYDAILAALKDVRG